MVTTRLNGLSGDLAVKTPVRVATTVNITLSGLQSIDGITVVEGDRVLVKDQTDTTQNGIYDASTGTWTRSKDFNGSGDVVKGSVVYKVEGAQETARWQLTSSNPVTIGTSAITFAEAETIINATFTGTSTTSLAIEIASKVFTTQAGKDFNAGEYVLIVSDAAPSTNYMHGQITSYSGTTLTVNVTTIGGSGTLDDWTIYKSGPKGAQGATGSAGDILEAQGSDVASAATVDLGAADSDYIRITGTTGITSFGTTTTRNHVWVEFTGVLTLTHNGTSLILPTGANIATTAGDKAEFVRVSAGNWKCVNYLRANGKALAETAAAAAYELGDVKHTLNSTLPSGWLWLNGETVGSTASAADNNHDDYEAFYTVIWNSIGDTYAPVSSGRGASAAADFAANKTITLLPAMGRAFIGDGQGNTAEGGGAGTNWALGQTGGAETHTLTEAELAQHDHASGSLTTNSTGAHTHTLNTADPGGTTYPDHDSAKGSNYISTYSTNSAGNHSHVILGDTANAGSGNAHNNIGPVIALKARVYTGV